MALVRLPLPSRTRHTLFDIRAQGCPGWGLVAGSECGPWRGMLYNPPPPPPSHTHPCCLRLCALLTCDDATTNKTKRQLGTRVRQHVGGLGHIKDNAPLPYYVDIPFPGAHTARVKPKRLYNWLGLALPIKRTLYLSCSGRTVLHLTSPSSSSFSLSPPFAVQIIIYVLCTKTLIFIATVKYMQTADKPFSCLAKRITNETLDSESPQSPPHLGGSAYRSQGLFTIKHTHTSLLHISLDFHYQAFD